MGDRTVVHARRYALSIHESTNHLYDGKPYAQHLHFVYTLARKFLPIVGDKHPNIILAATWCHALMPRQSYNDIRDNTNMLTAEIVYALQPEKGKTRNEKYNDKYYAQLVKTPYADFLKICDVLSDAHHAAKTGSAMINVYQAEYNNFKTYLFKPQYKPMFEIFDTMYNVKAS